MIFLKNLLRFSLVSLLVGCAALASTGAARAQAAASPAATAMPPGVRGDGVADDTAAIQAALDAAGKTGGQVTLPPGQYVLRGVLNIPTGVTLQGAWTAPHHGAYTVGSALLVYGGRGQEEGTATVTLQQSSAIKGFTFVWPEQVFPDIVAYPWAIHGINMHNTVEDVTFVNAYQGIMIGRPWSELHLIRNVFGCVLRRGVFIDTTSDIGRLENVHFNPHYWPRSGHPSAKAAKDLDIAKYMAANLEAFILGRSDWEYISNCFVFAAKVGFHFVKTKAGACNAQLVNIGADYCRTGMLIDDIQEIGLQVTNGAFTAFSGEPNVGVEIAPTAAGALQLVNCNFWATPGGAVRLRGTTRVTLSNCHILDVPDWDKDYAAVESYKGRINVNGTTFGKSGRAIALKDGTAAAIVTANLQPGGLQIENGIGARAQIGLNEAPVRPKAGSYRINVGTSDASTFLRGGWYGGEDSPDAPERFTPRRARWTNGKAAIALPVQSGHAYTLTVFLTLRKGQPAQTVRIEGGPSVEVKKEGMQPVVLKIPAALTEGKENLHLVIEGTPWQPSVLMGVTDNRNLGALVAGLEMIQEGGGEVEDLY